MSDKVLVACRLPNGINFSIEREDSRIVNVNLKGANQDRYFKEHLGPIILRKNNYGVTVVDADAWEAVKKKYGPEFKPFKSNCIIEAKNEKELAVKLREVIDGKLKTGFEGMSQTDFGKTGVEKGNLED